MTVSDGLLRLWCISAQRCCFNGPFSGEVADREAPDGPDAVVLTTADGSRLGGDRRAWAGAAAQSAELRWTRLLRIVLLVAAAAVPAVRHWACKQKH